MRVLFLAFPFQAEMAGLRRSEKRRSSCTHRHPKSVMTSPLFVTAFELSTTLEDVSSLPEITILDDFLFRDLPRLFLQFLYLIHRCFRQRIPLCDIAALVCSLLQ